MVFIKKENAKKHLAPLCVLHVYNNTPACRICKYRLFVELSDCLNFPDFLFNFQTFPHCSPACPSEHPLHTTPSPFVFGLKFQTEQPPKPPSIDRRQAVPSGRLDKQMLWKQLPEQPQTAPPVCSQTKETHR